MGCGSVATPCAPTTGDDVLLRFNGMNGTVVVVETGVPALVSLDLAVEPTEGVDRGVQSAACCSFP